MQGCFKISKLINVKYHSNRVKDKNHLVISIDAEKAFDRLYNKNVEQIGHTGTNLNITFKLINEFSKVAGHKINTQKMSSSAECQW
jgi:hypothetical protein